MQCHLRKFLSLFFFFNKSLRHYATGRTNGLFTSDFPIKILYKFLLSLMIPTCLAHLVAFHLIIQTVLCESFHWHRMTRGTALVHVSCATPKSPVVTICTTRFNTLKLCILPTQCICVFHMVLTINSDCFPKQH
jgi:hypothetical protein